MLTSAFLPLGINWRFASETLRRAVFMLLCATWVTFVSAAARALDKQKITVSYL